MNRKLSKWSVIGAAALGTILVVAPVKASDPVGVYALVDRVVFEPNEMAPTAVQVWGAFALAVNPEKRPYPPEEGYGPAAKGYLYYTCPAGKSAQCVAEWKDLQSMAGKDQVVGFGTRWGTGWPKLRHVDEKPASPDAYQMNIGVVPMGKYGEYPALAKDLKAALGRK
jgi:hypothetical protein